MAPHAYTPTTERDNVFDISNGVDLNDGAFASEGISTESFVHNPPPNGSTIDNAEGSTNGGNSTQPGEDGTITPFLTFEDAYVRGYKDGYTKSYIELKHQPIAIIGMSCRFPGNVSTPDEFWELLARSRTGFTSVPPSRFSENRFFHPNPGKSGTTNARGGNFLEQDLTVFDAPFFGFTQQEAISIDPQQRLLLECTFETLESAGIPKHAVVGQDVGVFVGGTFSEYEADLFRDPEIIPMHQATGCAMAMQSNRISHFFDFRGPSFTMDTACSSSLVAIHTACQSLRSGESKMAIAAGVHLNMLPEFWISYSMSRLFGEAGRSFAFDQRGTGYGRGEGCGMILLKPLDQAIADNDPIRAVICGTGINQDGKTPGITMPNGAAQEALIRSVYENVKIDPQDTGYVEAHGTGTRVGDPIEVTALHNVFGNGRTKRKPLFIGSVKSNIGHLEAAAGIAGVIKTALMLERGFVLPNYDFKIPNEKIPFDEWGLKVPTRQQPWPFGKKWASVNGFGFGGTNGHVVMTKGPLERKTMKEEIDTQTCQRLFLVSANDKMSTEKTMQELGIYLERRPEVFQNDLLGNLAYTLGQRKSLHPWRVAISASTGVELIEALFNGKIIPAREEYEELRFGWIFTGQGAQWWAMGRELRQQYPTYDAALTKADTHLRLIGAEFALLEELEKEESLTQVNAAHISQPACTAVQLALTDLLRSWGLQPSAVAGHSSGEIGAAYAANMITFEDAMTIAYHRGRLIPLLKNKFPELDGCMMAVGAGQDVIRPLIDRIPQSMGEARVACINSPSSITVSGDAGAITTLQELIEEAHPGMFARRLQVDTAYHSHHMNLVAKAYTESLMNLESPRESSIQLHSSLVGRLVTSTELDASYWVQNLVCPVKFDEAVQSMCRADGDPKINFLIELGPHAALQGPIKQTLKQMGGSASKIGYSSVLSRNKNAISTAHQLAGALFVKGALLNMENINFPKQLDRRPQVLTDLPRYAWNHTSTFYHESRLTKIHKYHDAKRNDIIGVLAPYSNDFEPTWRNIVRLNDLPWLRHHQIEGVTIFPISGFVSMAIEAADQQAAKNNVQYDRLEVHNLTVNKPAILTEEDLEMIITLYPDLENTENDALHRFVIRSWSKNNGWMHNCSGSVSTTCEVTNEVDGSRMQCMMDQALLDKNEKAGREATDLVDVSEMYEKLKEIGVNYGKAFRGLENCHASATSAVAHLTTADTLSEMPHNEETNYLVHPTLVERLVTMYWPILSKIGSLQTVHLPSSIGKICVSRRVSGYLQESQGAISASCMPEKFITNDGTNDLSMFAVDAAGKALITIENLSTSPILGNSPDTTADNALELCYKIEWEAVTESNLTDPATTGFDSEIILICGETQPQQDLAYLLSCELNTLTGRAPLMGTMSSMAPYMKGKLCIFLTELDRSMLAELSPSEFESLKQVLTTTDGILWVVRGAYTNSSNPDGNMILGLSRTLRSEGTLMRFVTLDLDFASDRTYDTDAKSIMRIFMDTLQSDSNIEETEFMERDGALFTPRIVDDPAMNEYVKQKVHPPKTEATRFSDIHRPLKGSLGSPDTAEKLVFEDDLAANLPLGPDDVHIQVRATGINLKDTTNHLAIGSECSGTVLSVGSNVLNIKTGDRVVAITADGSLATTIHAESSYVCKLPDHVSFEAAAAMSVAYCTALYSLVDQARLMDGEQILIHDAASPVGQAALCIAKMVGVDAWTTVRTANEKELLMREFGIAEYRIWSLDSDAVVQRIMAFTNGRGVEVAFNPVSEASALRTSARCLADFGRLVKVSSGHSDIASLSLAKNVTIVSTDIAAIASHRPRIVQRALADMGRLLRYGKIEPIHCMKILSINEFATTLQEMRAVKENEMVVVVPSDDEAVLASRIDANLPCLRQDATYILIGGTGGLGRSMAQWMVGKGAKHIVLLSRSGTLKGKAKDQVDALNENGASIIVRSCDVSNRADVEGLVAGLHDLPPVRGIVHGAMVLHDVLFEKMTYDQYSSVTASKVQGAWNFYHALNASGAVLDFFICISSAAGAVGNRGQAAYAAANTFLNGFVQYIRGMGISAASIDLTAVSDAGYLAEDKEKAAEVARNLGSDTICEAEVLALIEGAIKGELGSCNSHPITGMRLTMRPFWWSDAKFKHLREAAEAASSSGSGTKTVCWSTAFKSAPSRADAEQTVVSALVEKIAEVISMEPEALDPARALSHYPLDSLTAIEVRNFITRMFESNLQVLELLASGTIESLARLVCTKSKIALPEAAES